MIYVGTSGWQYRDWRGRFYPEGLAQSDWLPYYSARFPTVEVNNSFYRLPTEDSFRRWRERSAPGHVVAVKASRFITHMKRLLDPVEPLALFWSRARLLGDKLGPVLFQLPPKFRADVPRLERFIAALPDGIRPAFEFRDASWDTDEVRDILDRAGAALVLADRPGTEPYGIVTGGWSYVRFHQGRPDASDYPREKLQRWAECIASLAARDVYVYFNNDPGGAAVRDAMTFTEMLDALGEPVAHVEAA